MQQQKCNLGSRDSNLWQYKVCMDIRAGFQELASNDSGVVERAIFRYVSRYYSEIFTNNTKIVTCKM